MKIDGGCHCGAITFEAEVDPAGAVVCHCTDCQNLTGSAFRVTIPAPAVTFQMRGAPTIYIKTTADSGRKRRHAFCPHCGSPLYVTSDDDAPQTYGLRVGTIRQREQLGLKHQIWRRSALPAYLDLTAVPAIDGQA